MDRIKIYKDDKSHKFKKPRHVHQYIYIKKQQTRDQTQFTFLYYNISPYVALELNYLFFRVYREQ